MADEYIRKEDAIDAATQDSTENRTHSFRAGQARSASRIKALEPADVVPVVRCKECIHHHYESKDISYCDRIDYGYGWKDNDFCSRGERKE